MTRRQPKPSQIETPASSGAASFLPDLDTVEKATYGPGFGPSPVVLGPAGELAREIRDHTGSRLADKALYFYLYQRHPWVYACVELICQTAAQDRHTYPVEDAPGSGGKKSKKPASSLQYGGRATKAFFSPELEESMAAARQEIQGLQAKAGVAHLLQQLEAFKAKDAREDDGDEGDLGPEPNDGVEFLEKFFAEVNPYEGFNDLLESVYRDLVISGEAFVLKQRLGAAIRQGQMGGAPKDGDGLEGTGRFSYVAQSPDARVVSLHRIPSRYTVSVASENGYPSKFRQFTDGGGFREYAAADVIFFKLPDPTNPARGLSPLESLDLSLATDLSAAKYNEAYFRNGAKAGMVFSAQGLSEHEIRRNREWIKNEYVKPENAHKPMFLLGSIELVRDGNRAQNDMEFINLRSFTREDICAVYSVPISKLLVKDGSLGQAGKMSDDITFRADTIGPLQTKVYESFNRQLMKRDFKTMPLLIPPRQEKIRLDLLEAAKSLVQVGGTGNESRAILHMPEIDHPTMKLPLFLTPGLRSLLTDETANQSSSSGEPLSSGSATQTGRPDKMSRRTSQGQKNARVKQGRGMDTRKAEEARETDESLDDAAPGMIS